MKKHWYIAILFVALAGSWGNVSAAAGDPPAGSDGSSKVVSDTTEPSPSTNKLLADTSQPVSDVLVAGVDTTDPVKTAPVVTTLEAIEDNPAGDLYEDFDTLSVHCEKFDALTFDDTVMIVLNDPAHHQYVHPFNGNVTSTFAFRKYRYHFGMDINLETGDSVKCCFDGKVRIAQRSKTYGYVVVVRHNNGLETYYAHLSKLEVHPGDEVTAGTILGLGGNTGHSHGSHLHFEVRFRGQPIDPNYIIDFKNQTLRTDTYNLTKSDFKYLATTYKVRHYSRKKKKTWYTYYTPGGAHYATPEAKRIMAAVADPVMPGSTATSGATASPKAAPPTPPVNNGTAPKKTTTTPPAKTSSPTTKTNTAKTTNGTTAKPANGTVIYHTIKKGETLSALAVKYGTTVDKICKLNGIKATSTLRIGQKVRVK